MVNELLGHAPGAGGLRLFLLVDQRSDGTLKPFSHHTRPAAHSREDVVRVVEPYIGGGEIEAVNSVKGGVDFLPTRIDGQRLHLAYSRFAAGQQLQLAAVVQERSHQEVETLRAAIEVHKVAIGGIGGVVVFRLVLPRGNPLFDAEGLVDRVLHVVNAVGFLVGDEAPVVEAIGGIRLWAASAMVVLVELVNGAVGSSPNGILPGRLPIHKSQPDDGVFGYIGRQRGHWGLALLGKCAGGENCQKNRECRERKTFHRRH